MQKIVIDKNTPLKAGDLIELDFTVTSGLWVQSAQIALIEWQLSGRTDWEILSNSLPAEGIITFTVLVKDSKPQDPKYQTAGLTPVFIAAAIVAVGIVSWLMLREVRQIVSSEAVASPGGQVAMSGIGAAGIALLIFIVYKYILGK